MTAATFAPPSLRGIADLPSAVRAFASLSGACITGPAGRALGWFAQGLPQRGREGAHLMADDGETLHVRISGTGPPIILLHGMGGSHVDWSKVSPALAADHRVFAWDARGHGGHPIGGDRAPTLERMARDLANLIDHYALRAPVLVGHSMGALTVMQYLADYGGANVRAVSFVDQSPRLVTDEHWRLGLFGAHSQEAHARVAQGLAENFPETVLRELVGTLLPSLDARRVERSVLRRAMRAALARMDVAPILAIWEALGRADYRSLVAALRLPALVVLGGKSTHYGGLPLAQYYRSAMPQARVELYDHAGHSPHVQDAGRFAADLAHFVVEEAGR